MIGRPENQKTRRSENRKIRESDYQNNDKIQIMINDVTDLDVYQRSLELLPRLYLLLRKLPLSEKDLENQIKRAAKSVPANIAEGFAKRLFEKEFKRFLLIALGSNDEVVSHLRTLSIVAPKLALESDILLEDYKILSKRLNTLHKSWHFSGSH